MKNAVKAATLAILFMLFMPLVGHASSMPGDCNSDGYVDAGDVSALILEIFDGDGDFPEDAPGGIIPGDSVGSDANEDGVVDAGDVSCVMLLIFGGPGACHDTAAIISDIVLEIFDGDGDLAEDTPGGTFPGDPEFSDANVDGIVDAGDMTCAVLIDNNGQEACSYGAASAESLYGAAQAEPTLEIPVQVPADAGGTVTVPVTYIANGNLISSMIFSIDIDETNLDFNPESTTGFPWPDAITVNTLINPFVFSVGITYDANDTDGELDFAFSDINPPLTALPDGVLVTITFTAGIPSATTEAPVVFSQDPTASFGNTAGESVPGATIDGSVLITVQCTPTGISETICNGIDDDCDDLIDEDFTPAATTCGMGVCASTGQIVCVDGQEVDTCIPGPQDEAADVTCDGLDGDCDGQADEDFQSTPTTCGVGACEGNTGQIECQDGSEVDTCDPLGGAAAEVCDNLDNDCDGSTDEDLTRPTTCGVGECAGNTGEETCTTGTWSGDTCDPFAGAVPEGPPGDATCGDTLDNDCDGLSDLDDPDCEVVCTPTGVPESECNGIDDDCDGAVDEDFQPTATTCGVGECASTGQTTCEGGVEGDTCAPGTPSAEVCDNLDNDCDGSTDEELTRATTCGVGECAGNTGEETCTAGTWGGDTCDPLAGATAETCDNLDNDCDGSTDEELTRATTCGVGECAGNTGEETCTAGTWGGDTCDPLAGSVPEGPPGDQTCGDTLDNDCDGLSDLDDPDCEVVCTPTGVPESECNGIDDDCDGAVDEDFQPTATTCGVGECASTGQTICEGGVEGDTCTPGTPSAEVCDNLDNDCDGSIDEELTRPTTCGIGECAGNTGEETCTAGTWGGDTCDPLAGATAETCDNLDNDCDGSTDEELTRATTCGVGECAGNTGEETCTAGTWGGDTCDPLAGSVPEGPPGDQTCGDTLDNDCDGLSDLDDPDCEVVCTPTGVPESECNGIDDDCDGAVDEDFQPTATTCGVGECASTGQTTCEGGVEGDTCTPGTPSAEVCDNLDNDCDGSIDEELTRPTTCGIGECAGNTGEETCTAGTWGNDTCDPFAGAMPEGPPGDGTCSDTVDNDCDGFIDSGDSDCAVQVGGEGCTPGYWKQEQHFDSWNVFAPDTLFSDVFDDAFSGMTLLEVLDQNGDGLNSLGRHTVAALLNADSTSVEYDLTTTQVITMFNNAYPGSKDDYHVLKYVFEGFNEQVCPLN